MIEDMKDEDILDKARMEGMNQGIWLAVQELAHDGRWTQAAEELISSCGLTEDECRKLQEESESFNDEMIKFIDNMFGRENMISEGSTISENDTICINIKYHKIGEVFNYKVAFEGLREYSVTIPSGEYEGKMWKANRGGIWYLYWYDHDDNPSMIKIERREILLLN